MMQARLVVDTDPRAWAGALDGIPHSFAHTHAFASLMGRAADTRALLFVAEGANGKAVCPIAERRFGDSTDIFTPYGFSGFAGVGDLGGLRDCWRGFARQRGYVAGYVMQHPLAMPAQPGSVLPDMADGGRMLYRFDLSQDEGVWMRRIKNKKRVQRLRKWLEGAEIETGHAALAAAFVRLYPQLMARRGASATYQFSDDVLRALVALPGTLLVGVRGGTGDVSSVALMGIAPACGEYLFAATEENASGDGDGLLWLGMRALAAHGVAQCNLGGGIQEGDGLADFKRRIGGEPVPIPVLRETFDAARYQALCDAAGIDAGRTGFFPAYYA